MNNYLSICMFQMQYHLDCNAEEEFLLQDEKWKKQEEEAIVVIEKYRPDIALFPELAYDKGKEERFFRISSNTLVVAGSYYKNCENTTVVYYLGKKYEIRKGYASSAEPMARRIQFLRPEEYIQKELANHEFWIKGKKIYILNCMEYYHIAYYIARTPELYKDLFGICAICSNSNTAIFRQESVCLHNHNERIYSFVLNGIGTYQKRSYADGSSYIYGPVSKQEKEWLKLQGIDSKKEPTNILMLSNKKGQWLYGEFQFAENLSPYGRSDFYQNNPKQIMIQDWEEK